MIRTKIFATTKKELFKSLFQLYLKRRWWLIVIVFLIAGFVYFEQQNLSDAAWIVAMGLGLPVIMAAFLYYMVYYRMGKFYFLSRHLEISDEKIRGVLEDGRYDEIQYAQLKSATSGKNYFLLTARNGNLIYIPFHAFEKEKEKHEARNYLRQHRLLK